MALRVNTQHGFAVIEEGGGRVTEILAFLAVNDYLAMFFMGQVNVGDFIGGYRADQGEKEETSHKLPLSFGMRVKTSHRKKRLETICHDTLS